MCYYIICSTSHPTVADNFFPWDEEKENPERKRRKAALPLATPSALSAITSGLQTLHYSAVPYVCTAHKEVSLESADANYKFNLHFN